MEGVYSRNNNLNKLNNFTLFRYFLEDFGAIVMRGVYQVWLLVGGVSQRGASYTNLEKEQTRGVYLREGVYTINFEETVHPH